VSTQIEDAALERFLSGPAPYSSGNAVPDERPHYLTAQQELVEALEGQGPRLSQKVAEKLGPALTAELAQVIRRAVAVGIRRRAEQETADRLHGVYELLEQGLELVEPDCVSPEAPSKPCDHSESLYGRCVSCGMTWEQQAEERGGTCRCARTDCRNPVGVFGSLCDMCEAEGCPSRRD